jgi:hypothetical protein
MHGMRGAIVTLIAVGLSVVGGAGMVACSSSTSSTSSSSGSSGDGGGADTDSGTGADAASTDAADAADAAPVNGCKTFDDRTAAGATRTITWGFPLAAADRCIDIKVGQSVTWSGDFNQYRVAPSGGDTPNPISGFDGTAPTVKFPKAGTYGFESPDAPALIGAIRVNP